MGFLSGKRALIVGLATDRSIAWGIAQAMHREGASLAFSHIERMTDRVVPLAKQVGSDITFVMDVASDEEIARGFSHLRTRWEGFDILVHAVAFAPREALIGSFIDATTRDGFRVAHDISSYSLTALARESLPFMQSREGSSSIVSLSYLGAARSIPGYNVMGLAKASLEANVRFLAADLGVHGVRVNAVSAGPIKTLSAAGIPGLRKMLAHVAAAAPIRRNVTIEDVGNAAAFLCSDLAAGVTGEVLYVDGGYSTVGMSFPGEAEAP
jgi:enoyl-[acyl-carrier protein] reductase I